MTAPLRRLDLAPILVGNIGNVLEWYDFVVFAFLAPVIGTRFFPSAERFDTRAAARAYCRHMSSHLERASGKSRLGSRRKGRPATVVACERRDPI